MDSGRNSVQNSASFASIALMATHFVKKGCSSEKLILGMYGLNNTVNRSSLETCSTYIYIYISRLVHETRMFRMLGG